jgi:bifunctional DNase/RNase
MQCEIDSIRVAAACPELTLILKSKDTDGYLPIWIGRPQAEILADQLNGRPDRKKDLDLFLDSVDATDSDIECARVYLEGNTFSAKVAFSGHSIPNEVNCPIGLALALAVRTNAPILADEALFDKAGVRLT